MENLKRKTKFSKLARLIHPIQTSQKRVSHFLDPASTQDPGSTISPELPAKAMEQLKNIIKNSKIAKEE